MSIRDRGKRLAANLVPHPFYLAASGLCTMAFAVHVLAGWVVGFALGCVLPTAQRRVPVRWF